jgi:hypothetical protein
MITDMEMHSLIKYFENRGDVAFAFFVRISGKGLRHRAIGRGYSGLFPAGETEACPV